MKLCWESAPSRPFLPEVLVNCGPNFGLHPSRIRGTFTNPEIQDPHPALVRRSQDKARQERDRDERRRRDLSSSLHNPHATNSANGRPLVTFIDVDDMTDEAVEVSVDEKVVEVGPPVKKKRKKNRLD